MATGEIPGLAHAGRRAGFLRRKDQGAEREPRRIAGLAQDALEDAVLMGGDERQVREVLAAIVAGLVNPYGKG